MADKEVQYIHPPNNLRQKQKLAGVGPLDPAWIEAAERLMMAARFDYLTAAGEDLAKLQAAFDAAIKDPANRAEHMRELYAMVQSIKGQGSTFNYPLMSAIGSQLARFIEEAGVPTDAQMNVIKLHVEALRLIIQKKMEGEGGATGKEIVNGLGLVIRKMANEATA